MRDEVENKTWTASVNSFVRHLTDIHRVKVDKKKRINWCSLCHCDIGRKVVTHACFRLRPFFVQSGEKFDAKCKECGESYPNWRGLSNHIKMHKTQQVQDEYNRRNGLPVAGPSSGPGGLEEADVD